MRISDWSADVCSSDLPDCLGLLAERLDPLTASHDSLFHRPHPRMRQPSRLRRHGCQALPILSQSSFMQAVEQVVPVYSGCERPSHAHAPEADPGHRIDRLGIENIPCTRVVGTAEATQDTGWL